MTQNDILFTVISEFQCGSILAHRFKKFVIGGNIIIEVKISVL